VVYPPRLGAVPLGQLTSSRIDAWMRNLERDGGKKGKPLKASTIGLALTVLSRVLKDATLREPPLLDVNPCKKAHPPKVPSSGDAARVKAWSEAQATAFLAWARDGDRRWADLWHLALMSGGRRNELLCLRWQDIDERGITILNGKGGKVRHVPLDKGTLAMLRRRKAARGAGNLALVKPSALVFTTPAGGPVPLPNATQSFRYAVNRARRVLGDDTLPVISLHGTRHTMATIWLRAGVPVHTVSQRLGHASPVITMSVYAHVLQQEQDQHVDRVAERMAGGQAVPGTSITKAPPEAAREA
jgi:integrase